MSTAGTHTGASGRVDLRAYDSKRRNKIALLFWEAMLRGMRDEEGRVYIPSREVMDAMAMVGGMLLATSPEAKVPSQLRRVADEHAKRIVDRTREAVAGNAERIFDVVLTGEDTFQ